MKSNAQTKLGTLFQYPFFCAVGQPLPSSVTSVNNWRAAAKLSGSQKWGVCQIMARNRLQRLVEERAWHRWAEWNPLLEEIRPVIDSFLDSMLPKTSVPEKSIAKIKNNLRWDIMFMCLESYYEDIIEPFFYIPIVEPWYAAGHFPCGWDGDEFPDSWDGVIQGGQLIVF